MGSASRSRTALLFTTAIFLLCLFLYLISLDRRGSVSPEAVRSLPPRDIALLKQTFDEDGQRIYQDVFYGQLAKEKALEVVFPLTQALVRVMPLDRRAWWGNLPRFQWEPTTFMHYLRYIDSSTTVIDFGAWIGPTVLFAAPLAKRVIAIEADPYALAVLRTNIRMNGDKVWSPRIYSLAGAVTTSSDVVLMRTKGLGNSMSSVGKVFREKEGDKMMSWRVRGRPLASYLRMAEFDFGSCDHTFIKIDVESYECVLLARFDEFLRLFTCRLPTLYISMHSQITLCDEAAYTAIAAMARRYSYSSPGFIEGDTVGQRTGEFILSDAHV